MGFDGFDNLSNFVADTLSTFAPGSAGGDSVLIEQEDGPVQDRTSVQLRGRAMPYQLVAWEVSQRSKLTWYPGNPVATQQILGPEELPTTMNGEWKNRFIKESIIKNWNPLEIDTAEKAVLLFHRIARAGKRVRVQYLSEVRTGLLKNFRATYRRRQDIQWEMVFEWSSRNDEIAPRSALVETGTKSASDFLGLMNKVLDIMSLAPDIANAFVASILDSINQVQEGISTVFNLLRIAETVVNLPSTLVGAINNAVDALRRELGELIRRIGGGRSSAQDPVTSQQTKGPTIGSTRSALTVDGSGATAPSSSDTQEARFEGWRRTLVRALSQMRFDLQVAQLGIRARVQPGTTRLITVKEGETLYSISQAHYGSPDYANWLANTNRLQTAQVPPGSQLRIPARPFGASGNVEPVSSVMQKC